MISTNEVLSEMIGYLLSVLVKKKSDFFKVNLDENEKIEKPSGGGTYAQISMKFRT